jgi:ribosomal protein L7/L12
MNETSPKDPGLPTAVIEAIRQGKKVEAIKLLRVEQNIELKEAKERVEDYVRHDPWLQRSLQQSQSEAKRGLILWVLGLLALGAVGYYFMTGQ